MGRNDKVNIWTFTGPAPQPIKPFITLNSSSTINTQLGQTYGDPGATAFDYQQGDITDKMQVTSNVNTAVPGTYQITYNVNDNVGNAADTVTRTVIVRDMEPPIITLLGQSMETAFQGLPWTDPGATAYDTIDGDLTSSIVVTGYIDTNVANTYILHYNVQDLAGNNATQVDRTVIVL